MQEECPSEVTKSDSQDKASPVDSNNNITMNAAGSGNYTKNEA